MTVHSRARQRDLERVRVSDEAIVQMEKRLAKTVIGQPAATKAVAEALVRASTRMRNPHRPVGSFLFLGPTGVGKTEMSRAIAEYLYNDPHSPQLLILNMAEMSQSHSAHRILGAPPSYVGANEPGIIPHDWLNNPAGTILVLDEIEKAHPDVVRLFLSAIQEGSIMARNGAKGTEKLDFSNTLMIFTSNVGGTEIYRESKGTRMGFAPPIQSQRQDAKEQAAQNALKRAFPPEFLGRVRPIIFEPLNDSHYIAILDKFVNEQNKRSRAENLPTIELHPRAKAAIIAKAKRHQESGGRALLNAFEDMVLTNVSLLLGTRAIRGFDLVVVSTDFKGELTFSRSSVPNYTKSLPARTGSTR